MFINHLTDGIAQQDDKLVKRFNLALQLNAVYQENRDRNALLAQDVQVRVLKGLPFGWLSNGVPYWCYAAILLPERPGVSKALAGHSKTLAYEITILR